MHRGSAQDHCGSTQGLDVGLLGIHEHGAGVSAHPGPIRASHTLTVARMWLWASRSSCLSPSVSAVTAYLVAL